MKRLLSVLLTLCLLAGVLSATATPVSVAAATPFDEDNVVLSFGAISDIHIVENPDYVTSQKYATALRLLKKYAGGKLDAVTIAGDLSNSSYNSEIGGAFRAITDAEMGEGANVFFITGNHDAQDNQWDTLRQVYSDLAKYTTKDLPSSQHDRGNRHMVIGGYHYIGVNMMDYWNASEAKFAAEDLAWLDRELAAARADAPGQPIFVYTHAAVYGTTYGSDLYTGTYWGSKEVYAHLAAYPEVITFSGHVHFPIHDSRTIYQKDFTSLNCGSVQYMSVENGLLQSGSKTTVAQSNDISNGLLVQVDKHHNVKVTRLDFANDAVIREPFYISAPDLTNKSHLNSYRPDADTVAPTFGGNAGVSGAIAGDNLAVTFDAATDNDMVHHYEVDVQGVPSGTTKTVKIFSEFYLYPTAQKMPYAYTVQIPNSLAAKDTAFRLTLRAVDSTGNVSAPLTYTYNPNDKPPVIEGVENDGTYYTTQKVTATDTNLDKILVNGAESKSPVTLTGNCDATYTVVAVDKGGNRTVAVVHMKPVTVLAAAVSHATLQTVTFNDLLAIERVIRTINTLSNDANASAADKTALSALKGEMEALIARVDTAAAALNTDAIEAVRNVTATDVTAADKANLEQALADYNRALSTYGGNYAQETKDAVAEEQERIAAALKALGVTVTTTTTTAPTGTDATQSTTLSTDPSAPGVTDPTSEAQPTTSAPTTAAPQKDDGADEAAKSTSPWLLVGIGLAAVLVIGGGILLFLWWRKKRHAT